MQKNKTNDRNMIRTCNLRITSDGNFRCQILFEVRRASIAPYGPCIENGISAIRTLPIIYAQKPTVTNTDAIAGQVLRGCMCVTLLWYPKLCCVYTEQLLHEKH